MERAMKDLVGYTTKEKADEAIKIILDLKHYFEDNKIFFDEKLASEIEKLVTTAHNAYFDANWNSEYQIVDIPNENIQNETMEKRLDGFKKLNKVLPDLKKNIENEFRTLLGVNQGRATSHNTISTYRATSALGLEETSQRNHSTHPLR